MPISQSDLEQAIRKAVPVTHLEIIDQSGGCGASYAIFVVSQAFEGKNTLARHRFVNELLKDEIAQLHAFSQKTLTPSQWEAQKANGEDRRQLQVLLGMGIVSAIVAVLAYLITRAGV